MNVAIIGTGYVGLPTGVGLADIGHQVTCIDRDESKIASLKAGKLPIYEQGLKELFEENLKKGSIQFTNSMKEGIETADIVLIAVGTPPQPVTHEADLQYVYAACAELAPYLTGYTVVATKSTVPIGTGDVIETLLHKTNPQADIDVISLPEFLREGYAVQDFFNPDRIVVGVNSDRAKIYIEQLYSYFADKTELYFVSRRAGEAIKYAANSFLAIKIQYINEIADLCEKIGADVLEVAKGIGLDKRIGSSFLNPGPGFGGSCFPKDTLAMDCIGRKNNVNLSLIKATIEGNKQRKKAMAQKILDNLPTINDRPIMLAILGLAFKEGTDDCRDSPAIEIIQNLLQILSNQERKVKIYAYDPKASAHAKAILGQQIFISDSEFPCYQGADCLVILTEWPQFKKLNLKHVKDNMRTPIIVDCRNLLDKQQAISLGFTYHGVGR